MRFFKIEGEKKNIKKNYAVFHSHKWTESASYAFIWFVVVVDFFCSYSFPFVSEQDRCERISCKPWTMKWMKFIVKSQVTNENIGAFQLASIVSLFMRSQCVVSLSFSLSLPLTLSLSLDLSLFSSFVAFLFFKKTSSLPPTLLSFEFYAFLTIEIVGWVATFAHTHICIRKSDEIKHFNLVTTAN